jgi:hypothetical protein
VSVPAARAPWWRDRRARNRAAVGVFAALALTGMLFVAFTNYLFAGDRRVLIVTMAQDAVQADRESLKQACGDLPSVTVVADRGNPDPRLQGRFAVRFGIEGATDPELAALQTCINGQPGVRGFLVDDTGRD